MIYIHPVGGIGNFMHHIGSIYTLSKDNNDELGLLNIDRKIYDLIHDGRANMDHANDFRYLFNRFPNINADIGNRVSYPFEYTPLQYVNETEYIGYFQSEKYFKHRRDEIIELFKPTEEINEKVNKYYHFFNNISLHVRRNDYVKLYPNVHPPLDMNYYNEALSLLPPELKVLVFSDDIPWCKENFIGHRFVFIKELDYIELYIMTKMKYHIIANSSFSWWGAWLSNSEKTIAPNRWFGENMHNTKDLIPDNWIKI